MNARLPAAPRRALLLRLAGWAGLVHLALAAPVARAGLPEVVAAVRQGVVAIGLYNPLASPRFAFRGTGFVVGNGNQLATNAHVLPDDPAVLAQLALQLAGNRTPEQETATEVRRLSVVAVDKVHDVALLQFSGRPLPALPLAEAPAREGQAVAFTGFPIGGVLGFAPVTHRGIVSSIVPIALPPPNAGRLDGAAALRLRQGVFDIYQLDGTAYPGNSGGPLFDADTGEVLGLLNMVLVKAGRENLLSQPSGISYAIPVRFLRALMAKP